jgi:hypothetical protein
VISSGSDFTVDIRVDAGSSTTNAVAAVLNYPKAALTFETVTVNSATWGIPAEAVGGDGLVNVQVGTLTPVSGDQLVATVSFKAMRSASVRFDQSSSGVVDASTNQYLPLRLRAASIRTTLSP